MESNSGIWLYSPTTYIERINSVRSICRIGQELVSRSVFFMSWFSKRPSEEALKLRARDEYNQKDYKNAEKSLRKLREIAVDKTWANDVLARLYMNTSRHMEAIPLWKDNFSGSENQHRELYHLQDVQGIKGSRVLNYNLIKGQRCFDLGKPKYCWKFQDEKLLKTLDWSNIQKE